MKKTVLKIFLLAFLTFSMVSCSSDDDKGSSDILLAEHPAVTMGWGKGKANSDGYLSLSIGNGQIQTFPQVNDDDEATQNLVDIVFAGVPVPGGKISIDNPLSDRAQLEYCTNWLRKKGTQIAYLTTNDIDLNMFENIKTVGNLKALESQYSHRYGGNSVSAFGSGQGEAYIVKTFEGYLALIYLQNVQGTYDDPNARVTLRIKLTKDTY